MKRECSKNMADFGGRPAHHLWFKNRRTISHFFRSRERCGTLHRLKLIQRNNRDPARCPVPSATSLSVCQNRLAQDPRGVLASREDQTRMKAACRWADGRQQASYLIRWQNRPSHSLCAVPVRHHRSPDSTRHAGSRPGYCQPCASLGACR